LLDESIATMDRARARFDELARKRPDDPEVKNRRVDALTAFYVALHALALDRRRRGKPGESAMARNKADEYYFDLRSEQPDDAGVDAARRMALRAVADLRREDNRWAEIYRTLRRSELSAREAAGNTATGSPVDRSTVATLARVGYGYAKLALWDEAAAAFGRAYEIDPNGLLDVENGGDMGLIAWYQVAVLQLQGGQTDAYERLRERILRASAAGASGSLRHVIRTATLRPDPRSNWEQVLELARRLTESGWGPTLRGFALLRAGRAQAALDAFNKDPDWISGWPARAIAHHQLGQIALAREWLDRADQHVREDLDDALAGAGFTQSGLALWWEDWLLRLIWTREAHEVIEDKAWPDATWMQQQRARVLARVNDDAALPADPFAR
jgi:tetratricopeptide (TPR) repeat protein